MFQLRLYTLATAEAAAQYLAIWIKHIESLKDFGVHTYGVWSDVDQTNHRVVALVSFREGGPVDANGVKYMESPQFRADMEGFAMNTIRGVQEITLSAADFSPLK